jgi:hypothetical protein
MKNILLVGCLILTAACQPASPAPPLTPAATATRLVPTPVPVTSTLTITPPPTFTPEPPPRYFSEEFDIVPVYWSTLYASSGDPSRVETFNDQSALTFELYSPVAWSYVIYSAHEYEGVHIETRVESRGSDVNAMGLVCNYNEQAGWYEFNISGDGTYNLLYGQWLAEGIASHTPIANDVSEYIKVGDTTNELGLDCLEDTLQLYINGKLFRKIDVSRFELNRGKVGLAVSSFDEVPVILAFDWVRVSQP